MLPRNENRATRIFIIFSRSCVLLCISLLFNILTDATKLLPIIIDIIPMIVKRNTVSSNFFLIDISIFPQDINYITCFFKKITKDASNKQELICRNIICYL